MDNSYRVVFKFRDEEPGPHRIKGHVVDPPLHLAEGYFGFQAQKGRLGSLRRRWRRNQRRHNDGRERENNSRYRFHRLCLAAPALERDRRSAVSIFYRFTFLSVPLAWCPCPQ